MATVLFWDIDGTLLTTARAGIAAWERAVAEVLDVEVELEDFPTAGLTDPEIARALAAHVGRPADGSVVDAMLVVYERELPSALPGRVGHVMPGVVEILEDTGRRESVLNILLTGNTRAGAAAKLAHYGLSAYFDRGAFGDDGVDRAAVARRAWEIAEAVLGPLLSAESAFVIGDTPHDIACGDAIGVRTLAVATGTYDTEALALSGAWKVVAALPSAEEMSTMLGMEARVGR